MATDRTASAEMEVSTESTRMTYRVYKRRFWGLAQLVLLNIVVSWDVSRVPASGRYEYSVANWYHIVAHFLINFQYSSRVLSCLRKCDQLDEHGVLVCLLCC